MLQRISVIILSFGLFRTEMINGRCIGGGCSRDSTRLQRFRLSRSARLSPTNCRYYHCEQRTTLCSNCETDNCIPDSNSFNDNCRKFCCSQIPSLSTTGGTNKKDDMHQIATDNEQLSTDCGSNSDFSREDYETSSGAAITSSKTSSEVESTCPPPVPCPPPPPCPSPPPYPNTSNLQRFSRDSDSHPLKESITSILPEGVPVIPSPQLELLTGRGNIGFGSAQDVHLSRIRQPPLAHPLVQEPPVDNFPPHDCCTRCSGVSCMSRNNNAVMFGARTLRTRQNRKTKCNSEQLRKLMTTHIRRDPSVSKRAIQQAAEETFSRQFNVVCSRGDFSYITRTTNYCEVSFRGTACYAFTVLNAK